MKKEMDFEPSLFENILEKSSAVKNLFSNNTEDWVDLKVARFVNKDILARLFTNDRYLSYKRKHVNIAVFNLLDKYSSCNGLNVKDVLVKINGKKGRFVREDIAKSFMIFASDYLTLNPELRVKIVHDEVHKNIPDTSLNVMFKGDYLNLKIAEQMFPEWEQSWLMRVVSKQERLVAKLKGSNKKAGFSILSDEIQRNFFNLNNFLDFNNIKNNPFWIRAGDEKSGYFTLTPIENLTSLIIWEKTGDVLSVDEQKVFIDKVLIKLWKTVFGSGKLLTEVQGREGVFISRVKYFQALYLLDKTIETSKLSFGAKVNRRLIDFKEC